MKLPKIFFSAVIFLGIFIALAIAAKNGGGEQNYSCYVPSTCLERRECTGATADQEGCAIICKDKNGHMVGSADCKSNAT